MISVTIILEIIFLFFLLSPALTLITKISSAVGGVKKRLKKTGLILIPRSNLFESWIFQVKFTNKLSSLHLDMLNPGKTVCPERL